MSDDSKPDFIQLRLHGPFQKETIKLGYVALGIAILSALVCVAAIKIDEIELWGIKLVGTNAKAVNVGFTIADFLMLLIFQSKAAPDFFLWRRNLRIADAAIVQEAQDRRREPIRSLIIKEFQSQKDGDPPDVPLTTLGEDLERYEIWKKNAWSFSKQAQATMYLNIGVQYWLPAAATLLSFVFLLFKICR